VHVEAWLAELYVAPKGQMCTKWAIHARYLLVLELESTREDSASYLLVLPRQRGTGMVRGLPANSSA
jgi:hypothetical protein